MKKLKSGGKVINIINKGNRNKPDPVKDYETPKLHVTLYVCGKTNMIFFNK